MRRPWILIIPLLVLDILTKYFARDVYLPISHYFSITYTENTGILFGLFSNTNLLWILFSIVIIAILLSIYYTHKEYRFALHFILAGAFGNLIDRVFYGFVVDFIDVGIWPIFNLADVYIFTGIVLFLSHIYQNTKSLK